VNLNVNDPSKMMTEPNPAAEAAALAAASSPPPIPQAPAPAPAAATVNSAALNLAVCTAVTNLNSAITAISQAGTVNSDLALATQSCKQAITWLTSAAAKAPTA